MQNKCKYTFYICISIQNNIHGGTNCVGAARMAERASHYARAISLARLRFFTPRLWNGALKNAGRFTKIHKQVKHILLERNLNAKELKDEITPTGERQRDLHI